MEKIKREYAGPLIDIILDKIDEIVNKINEQEARYKKINEWIAGINEDIMEIREWIDKRGE